MSIELTPSREVGLDFRSREPSQAGPATGTGVRQLACCRSRGAAAATVELSGGEITELAHIACAGSAVWASGWFSAPFFRSLGGDQLSTQRSQLRFTFLRLPPDLLQLRGDGNPLSAFSLGGRLPGQARLRQVLRDRSTAAAWLRHRLHSARSSRYFARSLLRLLSNDRTRIRRGDFASSACCKIRVDPVPLASMPELRYSLKALPKRNKTHTSRPG